MSQLKLNPYFGEYGGMYVPQILVPALKQLESAFVDAQTDESFQAEFTDLLKNYAGRPTALTLTRNLSPNPMVKIYLKREDLLHGGAHKTNQVLGQALLAKRMGKKEIIAETERIKTDSTNLFERASLIAFTGTSQAEDYHARIGSLFEQGKLAEAYALTDEGYAKIRAGKMKTTNDVVFHNNVEDTTTWEQYKSYAAQGHEIASHTVTHPRLAVLDEVNMRYELEQSKADLLPIWDLRCTTKSWMKRFRN